MPPWMQIYDPCGNIFLSALVAAIPLMLLFYLLAIRRCPGHKAAALCTGSALVVALAVWKMPAGTAVAAASYGMAFGLVSIIWVVVTAVWLYNMTVESGEFAVIKSSLAALSADRRIQALFIAYAFGAFIEGAAGFGSPVAIGAAMLVGLGFRPLQAAALCLLCNSAPAAFGAIGVPVIVSGDVSGLPLLPISAIVGQHLAVLSCLLPFWLSFVLCGWRRTKEIWPILLVAGLSFSSSMYATARWLGPALADIVAGLVCLACLLAFMRVWQPKSVWRFADDPVCLGSEDGTAYSGKDIVRAWSPYLLLTLAVFVCGSALYKESVVGMTLRFAWPGLDGRVARTLPIVASPEPYSGIFVCNVLTAGGTAMFFAGILASMIMPKYGVRRGLLCFGRTVRQLRFSILSIALVLGLAYLMNYLGMSSTLGLAFAATGALFPFFAPVIGWMGVFLTGSDTSANALFSNLQRTTAEALHFDPNLMVAANSSGGVIGKMISP